MTSKAKFQAIRGTRDLLPPDTELWNHVEQTARSVFATFGFGEIRPPIFESTDLFARAVGGETDIVSKEMYTFAESPEPDDPKAAFVTKALSAGLGVELDDFEKAFGSLSALATRHSPLATVSLRPEATASVCRAYIEHNMQQLPQPVKLYYIGPMFRRERPQKGRYRQFYQIGAEVLENVKPDPTRDAAKELAKDAITDAELIQMLMTFFDKLKLPGVQLEINSIGHAADNCRRGYVAKLKSELEKVKDKLGADSQRRIETNPLRVLDSKLEHEQPIIATLPKIADHLCDDCKAQYAAVKRELELRGVLYKENWRLVRGLDYYMRTTFEITAQGLGSQNAVCGGGRYDGLVELLGGPPTKGIGFAIGEDRLILSLQEAGVSPLATRHSPLVYIAWMGANAYATAVRAAKDLRAAGIRIELPPVEQKFGKALERATKLGAQFALILGDNEVAEGAWTLKTLADGTQQKLTEPQLLDFLKKL
ncbi:MAG: histidine--tRNA ligase [Acidobacteria bacterium]|nr:histidine--tRNA ligase [Acidobacteriota bacterium]MBS1866282.1 histidine--tRNA ligase [Acidobacteriota bacterium]